MAIPDGLDGTDMAGEETTIRFAFDRELKPGTWRPVRLPYALTATITCERCGQTWILLDHVVAATGEVSPNVLCRCGFCAYIRLDGWAEHSGQPENITV